jgi:hypothetical protein
MIAPGAVANVIHSPGGYSMNAALYMGRTAAMAVCVSLAACLMSVAQQPGQPQTRIFEGQPGGATGQPGGEMGQPENRQPVRAIPPRAEDAMPRVQGGRGGTSSQPRATIRIAPRRIPPRPGGRWLLGVTIEDGPKGLRIQSVSPQSPAARFGLENGDYLIDVMGYPVGVYNGYYYPLDYTLETVTPPDGWVNILVWNRRTLAEEALWVRLEQRFGVRPLEYPGRGGVMPPPGIPRGVEPPPGIPRTMDVPPGVPGGGDK